MATYTVPDSIDYTGATDVTSALAAFIASVPNSSVIVFRASAIYKANIFLENRSGLTFNGNSATLRYSGYAHSPIYARGCNGLIIHDLTIQGDNADAGTSYAYHSGGQEYSAGLWLAGCSNVELYNVTTTRTWGDSIYLGSWPNYANWCDTVSIHNCILELNGRCGFVCDAARNVVFEYNTVNTSAMHVFDIEPFDSTAEGATNVQFRNNTIGSYGLTRTYVSFFFACNGIAGSTASGITVTDNTVAGNDAGYDGKRLGLHTLVDTARRTNIVFTNNTCSRTANGTLYPGAVLYFAHVDGLTIAGNTQPLSSGTLVSVSDCTNVSYTTLGHHSGTFFSKSAIKRRMASSFSALSIIAEIPGQLLAAALVDGDLGIVSYSVSGNPLIYPVANVYRNDPVNGSVLIYSGPASVSAYDYGVPLGGGSVEYKFDLGSYTQSISVDTSE